MSTILKALRRLEREKQPEPGKPLRDDVVAFLPGEPQEPGSRRTLWWAVAGGAGILALGVLWVASGTREREAARRAAVAPVPRPAATAPAPAPADGAAAVPAPVAEAAPRMPTVPRAASTTPEGAAAPRLASKTTAPTPGATAPELADPPPPRPYRLPDPERLEAFEPPMPTAVVEPASAPEVAAPEPAAPPAPEARVESTTWHPDPNRRRAVVSAGGRSAVTLREGDAIGELVILRVDPSGVVFLYQGREIPRRVGQ